MVPSIKDVWGYDREFCSSSLNSQDFNLLVEFNARSALTSSGHTLVISLFQPSSTVYTIYT